MTSQDLISKYIQKILTQEEQIEFDIRFENDEDFKKELLFHKNLKRVGQQKDEDNFKSFLSHLETSGSNIDEKKNYFKKWFYLAASIIVITGLTYFYNKNKGHTPEELFATYFEPYQNAMQPLVRGEELNSNTKIAFNAYENGNFKEALDLFDNVLKEQPNDTITFYKAITLLELNDTKNAISLLEKKWQVSNSFREKKFWYLALSYIKINDPKGAEKNLLLLRDIPESNYKKEESKALLKVLKQSFSENPQGES